MSALRQMAVLVAAGLLAGGCGYHVVKAVGLPDDLKTVLVRVEAPPRSDPRLADDLAREMRRVLRWNGRLQPVEKAPADAELVLRISTDRLRAVAFDKFEEVLDYQATVAVDAELTRDGSGTLWKGDRIAATRGQAAVLGAIVTSSSAFQGGDTSSRSELGTMDTVQLGEERRAAAREQVLRDLAEAVLARMSEGL